MSFSSNATSAHNAYQSFNGNTLRHSSSGNSSSSVVPASSFSSDRNSADKRKAPNDQPGAVGKNPVWELAKSLTKWKYTREEIIRIIRVKG